MSATVSPRPIWLLPASRTQRVPAELGDADGERDPGAGGGLVEQDGDRPRPCQGARREAVLLQQVGEVEDLDQLGGRQVVVTQEVPEVSSVCLPEGDERRDRGPRAGPRRRSPPAPAVRMSGGASRRRPGATALTMNPASSRACAVAAATGSANWTAISSPSPRTVGDQRVSQSPDAVPQVGPDDARVLQQAVPLDDVQGRERRRRRRPGCRRTSSRAGRARAGSRPARRARRRAPIGDAAAEALGERDDVRDDRRVPPRWACWWANQAPVRPTPVCTSSRTSRAPASCGERAGGRQVARPGRTGPRPRPGSASSTTAAVPVPTAALQRLDVPVGHVDDVAGQRLERLAVGGLVGEGEGAHRAAVEGALARRPCRCGRYGGRS